MMGRDLNWTALPTVVELLGVRDIEMFISQIMTIKNWVDRRA